MLILDIPHRLNDREIQVLVRLVKHLKTVGVSTIFISHKMNEIFEVADRDSIADGKAVGEKPSEIQPQELLIFMTGGRLAKCIQRKQYARRSEMSVATQTSLLRT